jgi:hypothetical protein
MNAEQREPARLGSVAFTTLLWMASAYVFFGAFGFKYPANVAPLMLGAASFVLVSRLMLSEAVRLVRRNRGADTRQGVDGATAPTAGMPSDREDARSEVLNERAALAWTIASIALLIVLGFLIGVTVAMIGLLRVYAREGWIPTIATTAGVIASLYVAFGVVLGVPFFPGLIGLWS